MTGTATDTATNSSSTSITVNLDLTPPSLSITSPSNGSSVNTPYVTVTGSVSDSLSGVGTVSCNGVPATIASGGFSCTVQLSLPSNTITVTANDLAGNSTSSSVSVNISMATATSIQVTPNPVTVVVGNTQSFTAIDQGGTRRPDATWSVNDTSIATLASDGSGTITAVAAGTVTVTATVGSTSGQSTVTVVSGSLTAGTALWTAPSVSGFTTQKIIQAVPTANGPDLYSIDEDSSGDLLVRAFRSDGEQLWQNEVTNNLPQYFYLSSAVGDNFGGILLIGHGEFSTTSQWGVIVDLSGPTGNQLWQSVPSGTYYPTFQGDVAVGLDGTIYAAELDDGNSNQSVGYVDVINGSSGAIATQVPLPTSNLTQITCPTAYYSTYSPRFGPLAVTADGSAYMEFETWQETYSNPPGCVPGDGSTPSVTAYSETLSLLRIVPGTGSQTQTLASYSLGDVVPGDPYGPEHYPDEVIPDGQGGVLVSWTPTPYQGCASTCALTIADIGTQGQQQASFPSLNGQLVTPDSNLVLGDNGTAFGTDGTNVVAFDVSNLQPAWTYTSTGGTLSFVAATTGGAVAVEDSQLGLIQIDPSGNASQPVSGFSNWGPWALGLWPLISNGDLAFEFGPDVVTAESEFPQKGSTGTSNRQVHRPTIADFVPTTPGPTTNAHAAEAGFETVVHDQADLVPFLSVNATVPAFQKELSKPIAAVGFIGDSFDINNAPNPPFSVGLTFLDANQALVRTPQSGDNPSYSFSGTDLQLFQVTHINTQARVVFIGACYTGPLFDNLWNIQPNTKGQVMIVPKNPAAGTNLVAAVIAWEDILQKLLAGSSVGDAVAYTNDDMPKQNYTERWTTIGDSSVKIKH